MHTVIYSVCIRFWPSLKMWLSDCFERGLLVRCCYTVVLSKCKIVGLSEEGLPAVVIFFLLFQTEFALLKCGCAHES
jgi:hypothetical protein